MNLTLDDVQWLEKYYPNLVTGFNAPAIIGYLEVSGYYDRNTQKLVNGRRFEIGGQDTFIADRFFIYARLDEKDHNGWPKVYDVEKRYLTIAAQHRIPMDDLHFYRDGHACLGFSYPWDPPFTLEHFVTDLVVPFFYRLAYVGFYGISAAHTDLWREHSHGPAGFLEHRRNVRRGLLAGPRTSLG